MKGVKHTRESILVIGSVPGEIHPLVDFFQSRSEKRVGGRRAFWGKLGSREVIAVITGPGQVNAVQGLTAAIERLAPSLVIQTGCAGAYRASELTVGDIGVAFEEIDIHLGLEQPEITFSGNFMELPGPLPFSVITRNGEKFKNRYRLDKSLSRWALELLSRTFENERRVTGGTFVTVSTITASDRKAALICKRYMPIMESMEGSGAAHVCIHYGLPFLEIRAVSNYVGNRDRAAWDLPVAFETSAEAARVVIANATRGLLDCR